MKNEDKIKTISELYAEKSKILSELSNITNSSYGFVVGRRGTWIHDIFEYRNINAELLNTIKKLVTDQYKIDISEIDLKLEQILTQK